MMKRTIFFSLLAVFLLMSALPAFSEGFRPFGAHGGPYGKTDEVGSQQTALYDCFRPFGAHGGPYGMTEGVTYKNALPEGFRLFGAHGGPYGMIEDVGSHSRQIKDEFNAND